MTKRCWFCGRADSALTDEHVLAEANFGGRLVTRRAICAPCNSTAGAIERQIAGRLHLAQLVAQHSHLWRSPAKGPRRPEADGSLASGAPARVRFGPNGPEPVWVHEHNGEPARAPDPGRDRVTGTRWGIGRKTFDEWPRFGAKVALGLASLVLEPAWLDTPGARAVQAMCAARPWQSNVLAYDPWMQPVDVGPEEPLSKLGDGEHALGLCEYDDGPCGWMVLFGELFYRVSLPDAQIPAGGIAWHLQPRRRPLAPGPLEALVERL